MMQTWPAHSTGIASDVKQGSQHMSAHLTVYAMALEAERPLRNSELEQARYLAEADAALGRPTDTLLSRLSGALGGPWRQRVRASRLMGTVNSEFVAVGQPAS
jgi:hypothetical protein